MGTLLFLDPSPWICGHFTLCVLLMMDPLACFITLFWSSVNTLRILGVSAFGERLSMGQPSHLPNRPQPIMGRIKADTGLCWGHDYDQDDLYLVRFLPSFTTPRTNILDIRGQFSRIHFGLKVFLDSSIRSEKRARHYTLYRFYMV